VGKEADRYWHDRWTAGLLLALAVIDNAICYAAFFTVNGVDSRMHNIVEMQLVLLPWLMPALMVFTCLGTASFAALVIIVECHGIPRFHTIMNVRIYLSALPCALICSIIFYYSEQTKWAPFTAIVTIMLSIFMWCLHMRFRWWHTMNTCGKILLDISGFLAFLVGFSFAILFIINRVDFITKSNEMSCPYAANVEMPVNVPILGKWFCAPWKRKEETLLVRKPEPGSSPKQLLCSDTFVGAFGASIDPHAFECPSGCLVQYPGLGLTGCGIYSTDSQVCIAAIHSGVLTDAGGTATVFGRLGLPRFERCSRYALTSEERQVANAGAVMLSVPSSGGSSAFQLPGGARRLFVTPPTVLDSSGARVPQAFHFNNLPHSQEYLWLKDWDVSSSSASGVRADRPWTRIEATVSARVAGMELHDEKMRLGRPEDQLALFTAAQSGQAQSTQCRLGEYGVICPGSGAAVVNLDFCQPAAQTCLA